MELRQLRYFLTIAREGTYGRAAEVLSVAQPALSRQIKKLEDEIGADLFVRHAHGVSLTPLGSTLRERAEHIVDEVMAVTRLAKTSASPSGCMKISVSPGTAEILAYPLSQMVAHRFPELRCEIVSMLMPARAELVREGKVAFAVMNASEPIEGLEMIPLMREQLCLIHRANDIRFPHPSVTIEEIADIPLVIGGPSKAGVRSILDRAFLASGLEFKVAAEVNTAGASKVLVLEGLGPTVHVAAMARAELIRGELKAVPIKGLYSTRVMAFSRERRPDAAVNFVMDTVRECLADLVASGRWIGAEILRPMKTLHRH